MIKKKFIALILLLFACLLLSSSSQAGLNDFIVYPHKVELDFTEGSSSSKVLSKVINVENLSKNSLRIKVYAQNWDLKEDGSLIFDNNPNEFYLSQYLRFNPREFDIEPGQRRIVRLSANLPEGKDGEYRTVLFFEAATGKPTDKSAPKLSVNVNFKARFGVSVYAYKGKVFSKAEISDLKPVTDSADASKKYLAISLKNSGNVHQSLNGKIKLFPEDRGVSVATPIEIDVPQFLTLAGRDFVQKIELPAEVSDSVGYKAIARLMYKTLDGKIEYTSFSQFIKGGRVYVPSENSFSDIKDSESEAKSSAKITKTKTKKSGGKGFWAKILPFI